MLITSMLALGYIALWLGSYISDRIAYWQDRRKHIEETPGYASQVAAMDAQYAPEPPDVELANRCGAYLAEKFPSGVEGTVENMPAEELMQLFIQLEKDAEQLMGVEIDSVDFYQTDTPPQDKYCGYYSKADNSLHINQIYILSGNPQLIREQVSTIFHELKHARQWATLDNCINDKDCFGYSESQIVEWAENLCNYISYELGDELYRKQPVEMDAFGFEKLVMGNFERNIA